MPPPHMQTTLMRDATNTSYRLEVVALTVQAYLYASSRPASVQHTVLISMPAVRSASAMASVNNDLSVPCCVGALVLLAATYQVLVAQWLATYAIMCASLGRLWSNSNATVFADMVCLDRQERARPLFREHTRIPKRKAPVRNMGSLLFLLVFSLIALHGALQREASMMRTERLVHNGTNILELAIKVRAEHLKAAPSPVRGNASWK